MTQALMHRTQCMIFLKKDPQKSKAKQLIIQSDYTTNRTIITCDNYFFFLLQN